MQLEAVSGAAGMAAAWFCPDRGLALVHQSKAHTPWRAYDTQGTLVSSLAAQNLLRVDHAAWAPAGQVVMLHRSTPTSRCLWLLDSPHPAVDCALQEPHSCLAWATPYSGKLLVSEPNGLWHILSLSPQGGSLLPLALSGGSLVEQEALSRGCALWGTRLVVPDVSARLCTSLHILSCEDGTAVLRHTLTCLGMAFVVATLRLSACGALCAAIAGVALGAEMRACHLAVVHLSSATLRTFPLSQSEFIDAQELVVAWAPESQAILVCDDSHREVVQLCGLSTSLSTWQSAEGLSQDMH